MRTWDRPTGKAVDIYHDISYVNLCFWGDEAANVKEQEPCDGKQYLCCYMALPFLRLP